MLTEARINDIRAKINYGDGWDGDAWDYALAKAIEAEVRAEAQEPCQHCGGTKGHWEGCKAPIETGILKSKYPQNVWSAETVALHFGNSPSVALIATVLNIAIADARSYIAPPTTAPCPKCEENEKTLQAIAEHVDWAFIGDLDDVVASRINERNAAIAHFAAERDALQAEVAELEVERNEMIGTFDSQIKALQTLNGLDEFRDNLKEEYRAMLRDAMDTASAQAQRYIATIAQQAALIEKCERCLEDLSGMGWAEEALAAIAAHRSQS